MTAVDTNVLVRIVVENDADQVVRARAFMDAQDRVFGVFAVSNVVVEDRPAVMFALDWYERGMDFADALHLASLADGTEFATFYVSIARTAGRLGVGRVVTI